MSSLTGLPAVVTGWHAMRLVKVYANATATVKNRLRTNVKHCPQLGGGSLMAHFYIV